MPKIIEDLEKRLLEETRRQIEELGYGAMTVRSVAKGCGVGVGTVYNYFPSKDVLAATVMLEDWQAGLQQLRSRCQHAPSVLHGLRMVYDTIMDFVTLYEKVWGQYSLQAGIMPFVRARHNQLIGQLEAEIEPLLEQFDCLFYSRLPAFLAESLLNAATRPDVTFNDLLPILQKLCHPE